MPRDAQGGQPALDIMFAHHTSGLAFVLHTQASGELGSENQQQCLAMKKHSCCPRSYQVVSTDWHYLEIVSMLSEPLCMVYFDGYLNAIAVAQLEMDGRLLCVWAMYTLCMCCLLVLSDTDSAQPMVTCKMYVLIGLVYFVPMQMDVLLQLLDG